MSPKAEELFHQLVDLSPEARAQYLSAQSVSVETRREVEALLAHDSLDDDPLAQPVGLEAAHALLRFDARGARCGAFRLESVLGRGGMGVVYLAVRVDGEVTQRAAVKLMHPGWSEVQRERFLQEREILAALTHPNIAHLLDAGHLEDGQPYLAMEYVEGKPIDQYCEGFTIRQKLELFLKVCGAVSYLHQNQVIHRDLKPSNILLTKSGEPKLLDFGIAKMLDPAGDATATHLRMLTPDYASPEQVSGGMVGTASDIYSLGAVLHEVLTGKSPQELPPEHAPPELNGDLQLILQKTLRHEPHERYSSIGEFAGDLKAYLDSRPIRARQGERIYRARKFARRYWLSTALTAAIALAVISTGILAWYWSRPVSPFKEIRPERLTANTSELPIQTAAISPDGTSVAYSDSLGIHLIEIASGKSRLLPATSGHVLVQWMPDHSNLQTQVQDVDGKTTLMLVSPMGGEPVPAPASESSVPSPDGMYRAAQSSDRRILSIHDANGKNAREVWKAPPNSVIYKIQWRPNSNMIAVLSGDETISKLELIDVIGGRRNVLVSPEQKVWIGSIAWANQDRMIVTIWELLGDAAYNTNLWEVRVNSIGALVSDGLRKLTTWRDFPMRSSSFTIAGNRLAFIRSFSQRDVYVADLDPSRTRLGTPQRLTLNLGDDYPTGWTRDSKAVIFASNRNGPRTIFRQDIDKLTADPMVVAPGSQLLPRVTPDGKSILFWSVDPAKGAPRLMRVGIAGGTPELLPEVPKIVDFRCSRAGPCMMVHRDGKACVVSELDLVKGKGREIFRYEDTLPITPDISPDGKWLAEPSGTKVKIRSFLTGAIVKEIPIPGVTRLLFLYYPPDGKGFFVGDTAATEARELYVDLSGKVSLLWRQAGSPAIWGVPSPDGKHLAMMMFTDESNVYTVDNF